MNFSPQAGKKRDQTGAIAGHMAESKGLAPLPRKLYECVICKGSFSCWRALGGHMKIHRKEQALLRQSTPYDRAAGSLSKPTLPSLLAPYDQATGFSLTFPRSSAIPKRVKHSFSKTQFKFYNELFGGTDQGRFKAEKTKAAAVGDGLDLELRLG
ncbi:hypothetical protein SUGI_0863100 [Cryptomeria japonica]|uniref:uncharacterized protein LOC131057972 n=1 Tax=Cryptomeria japonica TaxID=3369 RepID=UPI0024148FB3|nr:uncharacterized protein LOC131057972 [Cryptomeria japonica]GLJ41703.1 hypothetical protein SUGI_0863100 [Cryptomeria japonica]